MAGIDGIVPKPGYFSPVWGRAELLSKSGRDMAALGN
jgi:hypothetical protein